MKKRGVQVFWSIAQHVECDPQMPKTFFGDDYRLPVNNAGSALSKAVKELVRELLADLGHHMTMDEVTKALRSRGVTYKDSGERAILIVKPVVVGGSPVFKNVCDVSVNKKHGTELEFNHTKRDPSISDADYEEVVTKLKAKWQHQRLVYDRTQIANLVSRFVRGTDRECCHGVSLRPRSGGVYYVAAKYENNLERVKAFFQALQMSYPRSDLTLTITPIYDEEAWNEAIEIGASYDMANELQTFIEKFERDMKSGVMTKRMLKSRVNAATEMRNLVERQRDALQSKADDFKRRTADVFDVLDRHLDLAEEEISFDLTTELQKIADRRNGVAPKPEIKVIEDSSVPTDEVRMINDKGEEVARIVNVGKENKGDQFDWLDD